jgi:hypothetical protein
MNQSRRPVPGPLFETPEDRVLTSAPAGAAGLLREYLKEPLREVSELREEVRSYLSHLEHLSTEAEFLDLTLARRIGAQCAALLEGLNPHGSEDAHRLVQAAIRYFIEDDDAEGDTTSPIGFDDDAEVVEIVARELGREDVLDISGEEP